MSSKQWLGLILVSVFALTSCRPQGEQQPAEEVAPAPEMGTQPMVQQEVVVTNTSTEPVTVHAMVEGREQNLGTVQPNQSQSFMVTAQRGTSFEVAAKGPGGQVIDTETIQVTEMRQDWQLDTMPATTQPGMQPGTQPEGTQPGTQPQSGTGSTGQP